MSTPQPDLAVNPLRDKFFALRKQKPKVEKLEVPDLGEVYVRVMSAAERDEFEDSFRVKKRGKQVDTNQLNARAKLLCYTVCDSEGNRLFSDTDAGLLGDLPFTVVDQILEVVMRINSFSEEDVKDLEKN